MNINKFTQKSIQAVQDCEKIAYDFGHQELLQEHLLYALMKDSEGLLPKLFAKMEMVPEVFTAQVEGLLSKRPKVVGSGAKVYVGNDLNKVLIYAEDEAKAMGDAYVSVEHLFLSMLKNASKEVKSGRVGTMDTYPLSNAQMSVSSVLSLQIKFPVSQ